MARRSTFCITAMLLPLCAGCVSEPEGNATGAGTEVGDGAPADDGADDGVPPGATTTAGPMATSEASSGTADAPDPDGPVKFDLGATPPPGNGGCGALPDTDATLTGTVYGPDGDMPISGALVYTTNSEPAGIPQHVYCDECAEIDCSVPFTLTEPDGSFSLQTPSGPGRYLVVRKGQFMRVTPLDIVAGSTPVSDTITTLPSANNPAAGQYIPRIAIGNGSYDRLEDALAKFGLGQTSILGMQETLVAGTEQFDLWDNGSVPANSQGTFAQLVSDPDLLDDYHIIFVPCSSDTYLSALSDPQNVQNIRDWVAAGGRWYVADWSNEWMEHVFSDYQTLEGEPNGADLGSYDSIADVLDPGLVDWLDALPPQYHDINPLNDEVHPTLNMLPLVPTVDNWSVILATPPVLVDDGMGGQVDVGHKVWLQGPGGQGAVGDHPLTVTGQYGCGKIQFTSYHAAEFFDYVGLSPQELVLIYTILELGVCQDATPPPVSG